MRFDVIVVGGSYAGLSAALALGRARKRTLVIDGGKRRNRYAHSAHNLLGQDGRGPDAIAGDGRAEVAAYPTVSFVDGTAISAVRSDEGFTVELENHATYSAARLILATGVEDDLPDLPGLRERWGKDVFHCPYCHGFEVAGRRLGVLAFGPVALHQAQMIPDWGPTTFLTNGLISLTANERVALEQRGVTIEDDVVEKVIATSDSLSGVLLRNGAMIELDALFIAVPWRMASPLAEQLGCEFDETALGPIIRVDPMGQTSVPGVLAVGDAAQMLKSLASAVASGSLGGAMAHQSLLPTLG